MKNNLSRDQSRELDKLDNRLARLWPEEGSNGNGNGHGKIKEWKSKQVIPVHEWEEIAGLAELYRKTEEIQRSVREHPEPEVRDNYKMLGRLPDWALQALEEIRHGIIRPEALNYFPDDLIFIVFGHSSYSRYFADIIEGHGPDIFNQWKQDYTELLEEIGVLDNGERIEWLVNGQTAALCSENRAIVNGLYFTADNSNYKF